MSQIFISYRRADTQDIAARLYDRLRDDFGADQVFFDTSTIETGSYFDDTILQHLYSAHVILVVIGERWLEIRSAEAPTVRRLDQPDDWVRREVERALERQRIGQSLLIPILVNNTPPLNASQLPESLRDLARIEGMRLRSGKDFETDVSRIIERLRTSQAKRQNLLHKLLKGLNVWQRRAVALVVFIGVLVGIWAGLVQIGVLPPIPRKTVATQTSVYISTPSPLPGLSAMPSTTEPATPSLSPSLTAAKTPTIALRPTSSLALEELIVYRDFDGIAFCTPVVMDLTGLEVEFVDQNEKYVLEDVFPEARQARLNGQGCACIVRGENDLPAQCNPGNSSQKQTSVSNWVLVELAINAPNGESCMIASGCVENCTCEQM